MTQKGKFIVIDGTDGAGKTSMTSALVESLEQRGIRVIQSREPGGTPFAEKIRELLLWNAVSEENPEEIDYKTELLLMFASRNQHIQAKIIPELEKGTWVVCERWTSSTIAYQGFARGIGPDPIWKMHNDVCKIAPDLTLIFDVPPAISKERMKDRSQLDHFERENAEFFDRVRDGYRYYAQNCTEKCTVIDASKSYDEVKRNMISAVRASMKFPHDNNQLSP